MKGALDYVRRYYGVPAKRGLLVTVNGRYGVITGANASAHILVRFFGATHSRPCHPTWRVDYKAESPQCSDDMHVWLGRAKGEKPERGEKCNCGAHKWGIIQSFRARQFERATKQRSARAGGAA